MTELITSHSILTNFVSGKLLQILNISFTLNATYLLIYLLSFNYDYNFYDLRLLLLLLSYNKFHFINIKIISSILFYSKFKTNDYEYLRHSFPYLTLS